MNRIEKIEETSTPSPLYKPLSDVSQSQDEDIITPQEYANDSRRWESTWKGSIVLKGIRVMIFVLNILSQVLQNFCLPLALTEEKDRMAYFLVYQCFQCFIFFSLLDVILDFFIQTPVTVALLSEKHLILVGILYSFNGIASIFGGSANRTPLTIQMSTFLVINMLAPFYKLLLFRIPFTAFKRKRFAWYGLTFFIYTVCLTLTLVDTQSSNVTWFVGCWIAGTLFGVGYNVHQEKMLEPISFSTLSTMEALKSGVSITRKMSTWLFIFSCISLPFSLIPGFDNEVNSTSAEKTLYRYFLMKDLYLNLFIVGFNINILMSLFMNKYDSSFNVISLNLSAILVLWIGWIPQINAFVRIQATPYTIAAMVIAAFAVLPSFLFSRFMKNIMWENQMNE